MHIPSEREAISKVRSMLSELTELRLEEMREPRVNGYYRPDAVLKAESHTFVVEWVQSGSIGRVSAAASQIQGAASQMGAQVIPLIAVPYMSDTARAYCEDVGIAWLDLSGNARIIVPGIRVHILGQRNQFIRPGRPENVFEPKASRVARWLLMHPGQSVSQREIAAATGLSEGHTSRVVRKLIDDNLVTKNPNGVVAPHPDRLLDAWREAYRFEKHTIIKGHIAARTGDELVHMAAKVFEQHSIPYAVTGFGAAWMYTQHALFRLATVYLKESPSEDLLKSLSFREEPRGANTWLVIPNDDGVFQGAENRDGIRAVHPVQAYLDLKAHPERAEEAAQELRNQLLRWSDS